jgi:hypothetical protein
MWFLGIQVLFLLSSQVPKANAAPSVSATFSTAIQYQFDTDGNAIDLTSGGVDYLGGSYVWYGLTFGTYSQSGGPTSFIHISDLFATAPLTGTRTAAHAHQFQALLFNSDGTIQDLDCSLSKTFTISFSPGYENSTAGLATTASASSNQRPPTPYHAISPPTNFTRPGRLPKLVI